jgi:hypothetical protein
MGSMASVAPHRLVVALRQLLWQEESRTVSPMSGAAGSLEDGRGISAAGQHPGGTDECGRRSSGMRQDHAAAALARRIVQLEARRTSAAERTPKRRLPTLLDLRLRRVGAWVDAVTAGVILLADTANHVSLPLQSQGTQRTSYERRQMAVPWPWPTTPAGGRWQRDVLVLMRFPRSVVARSTRAWRVAACVSPHDPLRCRSGWSTAAYDLPLR